MKKTETLAPDVIGLSDAASAKQARQVQTSADEVLISFTPSSDFRGKPFPGEAEMSFKAGIASTPVPASWVSGLSEKKTGDA